MFGTHAASKTVLNAVTPGVAAEFEADGIKVNAACLGFAAGRQVGTWSTARPTW